MASLVDYEDSDSEQDCGSGAPPPYKKPFITSPSSSSSSSVASGGPCYSLSSLVAPGGPYSSSSSSSVAPSSLYSSSSMISGDPCSSSSSSVVPGGPYSSSSSSVALGGPQKRPCVQSCAVRPYVPKRQRVCAVGSLESAPPGPAVSPLLSGVSERVRPFLSGGPVRAELPRRLRCGVRGHQSPVTALQWSPEPRHSHLLLSSSMDNSCKVNRCGMVSAVGGAYTHTPPTGGRCVMPAGSPTGDAYCQDRLTARRRSVTWRRVRCLCGWRTGLRSAVWLLDRLSLMCFCVEASVQRSEPGTHAAVRRDIPVPVSRLIHWTTASSLRPTETTSHCSQTSGPTA
ncbi:WD repeat-containing protein 25 isoform X3 [Danio rerio]|uniref:WD repeat-containing protein 25 isoform X3 n=1 Tax=Danio rerio TaxID=7955 RepID=A0AC58HQ08_DANRE